MDPIIFRRLLDDIRKGAVKGKLILRYEGIDDSQVISLCKALSMNPGVTGLDLSDNLIRDCGASALAENRTLKTLILNNNKITDEGAIAFATNEFLTSLDLSRNRVTDAGAIALSENNTLTFLALSNCYFNDSVLGDNGAEALARSNSLIAINLNCNNIGDRGAVALAANPRIISLSLAGSVYLDQLKISDEGACAFAKNTTLKKLDLSENHIKDIGATALAQNEALTSLDLSGNPISAADIIDLFRRKLLHFDFSPSLFCSSIDDMVVEGGFDPSKLLNSDKTLDSKYYKEGASIRSAPVYLGSFRDVDGEKSALTLHDKEGFVFYPERDYANPADYKYNPLHNKAFIAGVIDAGRNVVLTLDISFYLNSIRQRRLTGSVIELLWFKDNGYEFLPYKKCSKYTVGIKRGGVTTMQDYSSIGGVELTKALKKAEMIIKHVMSLKEIVQIEAAATPGEAGKPSTEGGSKIELRKVFEAESSVDAASDGLSPGFAVEEIERLAMMVDADFVRKFLMFSEDAEVMVRKNIEEIEVKAREVIEGELLGDRLSRLALR